MLDENRPHKQRDPMTAPSASAAFDVRALLIRICVGIVLLFVALAALGYTFKAELFAISEAFVQRLGMWGVFFGFLIPDATALPLPHEAFSTFALIGGIGFWSIVGAASAGSLIGGTLGFFIGRRLQHTRLYQSIMTTRGAEMHRLVERHGVTAVAIGALSPLPYSLSTWAAGALGMPFRTFILVSLLRIPRVAFYLWLVQLGVLTVQA